LINEDLARRIIRKLDRDINFNINIINSHGIIIASRDTQREGSFHEAAYRMIIQGIPEESVHSTDAPMIGTKPGVNLCLHHKDKSIGVVGVTGEPDQVKEVAHALKTTIELMVELDELKSAEPGVQDHKKQFADALLYDVPANPSDMEAQALNLGYRQSLPRIPVLITFDDSSRLNDIVMCIKESDQLGDQDILISTRENDILIFRVITIPRTDIVSRIKQETSDLIGVLRESMERSVRGCRPVFHIGSIQSRFISYRDAFRQTEWLVKNHTVSSGGCVYFLDQVQSYFLSRIPGTEFQTSFRSINDTLSMSQKFLLYDTIRTLIHSNLSIKSAAMEMGVHRNTITARIEKIREIFGIDIIADPAGREFLSFLINLEKSSVP